MMMMMIRSGQVRLAISSRFSLALETFSLLPESAQDVPGVEIAGSKSATKIHSGMRREKKAISGQLNQRWNESGIHESESSPSFQRQTRTGLEPGKISI